MPEVFNAIFGHTTALRSDSPHPGGVAVTDEPGDTNAIDAEPTETATVEPTYEAAEDGIEYPTEDTETAPNVADIVESTEAESVGDTPADNEAFAGEATVETAAEEPDEAAADDDLSAEAATEAADEDSGSAEDTHVSADADAARVPFEADDAQVLAETEDAPAPTETDNAQIAAEADDTPISADVDTHVAAEGDDAQVVSEADADQAEPVVVPVVVPVVAQARPAAGTRGSVSVGDGVVAKVVNIVVGKIDGVHSLDEDGISVEVADDVATIRLSLAIEWGHAIRALAEQIRTDVIDAVEQFLGLDVAAVDVHVSDIHPPAA